MAKDVDIETLRLLVAIQDHGSLSAAARERGVSQPAASARMRSFEARWRLSVIQRSPRGSTLTTDGLAVAAWAQSVLRGADQMRAGLDALSAERSAGVVIAASLTVAEFILPQWLGELHANRPEVQPRLHVVNSDRVSALVREGLADVGFIETAVRPTDLVKRQLGVDSLCVVVARDHPWARRRVPFSLDTLQAASWVLRETGSGTRSTFETALGAVPKIALEGSSTAVLIGAALAGVGPAVVSARAVKGEIETGRLVEVVTDLKLVRPLTAVWQKSVRLQEPVEELLRIAAASGKMLRSSDR